MGRRARRTGASTARSARPRPTTASGGAELRWWFLGLTEPAPPGWSDAAFIVLVLAGVTYDGMRETAFGAALLESLLTPITDALGVTSLAFLLTDTAALALVVAAFIVAFCASRWR